MLNGSRFVRGALLAALVMSGSVRAAEISSEGRKLGADLDAMKVEDLWLAKQRVNWKTGEPLGESPKDGKGHTHCSAFVAAFCFRQDVYILRPPEHSSTLLANAQFDWLASEGRDKGWKPVGSSIEAQHLANRGIVVVATYRESDPKKPGHIAIVRPSTKSDRSIEEEGPQIIQAGMTNDNSTTLREGFKHHPAAWKKGAVRYFAHEPARP
ncbi:MAG TPA: hypothetical protein VF554_11875 [Thermoanaerobaculia bacterium]|jgi:hypothetical protein